MYSWGSNSQGQLGVGDERTVGSIVKLESLGKGNRCVSAKGNQSYIIDNCGLVQKWPNWDAENQDNVYNPTILEMRNQNVQFKSISCGEDFMVALSYVNCVYSTGVNKVGQLGLGDKKDRSGLVMVKYFIDHGDKISQISAGGSHVIARNMHGGLFSWGYNKHGQLGTGGTVDQYLPKYLRIPHYVNNIFKVQSVQAGYSSSHILMEDNQVFFAGYDTMKANDNVYFIPLDWKTKLVKSATDIPFKPVKIMTKWSKSVSVTYLVLADFRDTGKSEKEMYNFCSRLANAWEDNYNQIIPFIETDLLSEYNDRTTPKKEVASSKKSEQMASPVKEHQKTVKKSTALKNSGVKGSANKFNTNSDLKNKIDDFVQTGSLKKKGSGLKVNTGNKSSSKKIK